MKTPQQRKNLEDARDIWWPTVPEANVYPALAIFSEDCSTETNCGTVACFGGWSVRWPAIAEQGFALTENGIPYAIASPELGSWPVSKLIYGGLNLFNVRGLHPADHGFTGSDHALVMRRIKWELKHDC